MCAKDRTPNRFLNLPRSPCYICRFDQVNTAIQFIKNKSLNTQTIIGLCCIALAVMLFLWNPNSDKGYASSSDVLPDEAPRIASDSGSAILQIVTSVNSARRSALRNANLITSIVNAFPSDVEILIFTNDREVFSTPSSEYTNRVRFLELPKDNAITIWPQDPFVVLTSSHGNEILMSKKFERADDAAMAPHLAEHLGWPLTLSSLEFEGGNIVVDEDKVFIGENTIVFNALSKDKTVKEIVQQFQQDFKREVFVIGPTPQPIPHIDMILTPLGNKQFAVADSRLGAAVVQKILNENPAQVEQFELQSEQYFFGHPDIEAIQLVNGEVYHAPGLQGASNIAVEQSLKLADYLDALSASLQKKGYRVFRVPLLQQWQEDLPTFTDEQLSNDSYRPRLNYPILTYNNVLLESRENEKRVYLPQYGLATLDESAQQSWEEIGYKVIQVDGFTTSALYGGALRCSVKVLRRQ